MLESLKYVDKVIPEENWEQKVNDIVSNNVDVVVMGSDWENSDRFNYLREYCDVVFLSRTHGISTTLLKSNSTKDLSCEKEKQLMFEQTKKILIDKYNLKLISIDPVVVESV